MMSCGGGGGDYGRATEAEAGGRRRRSRRKAKEGTAFRVQEAASLVNKQAPTSHQEPTLFPPHNPRRLATLYPPLLIMMMRRSVAVRQPRPGCCPHLSLGDDGSRDPLRNLLSFPLLFLRLSCGRGGGRGRPACLRRRRRSSRRRSSSPSSPPSGSGGGGSGVGGGAVERRPEVVTQW